MFWFLWFEILFPDVNLASLSLTETMKSSVKKTKNIFIIVILRNWSLNFVLCHWWSTYNRGIDAWEFTIEQTQVYYDVTVGLKGINVREKLKENLFIAYTIIIIDLKEWGTLFDLVSISAMVKLSISLTKTHPWLST